MLACRWERPGQRKEVPKMFTNLDLAYRRGKKRHKGRK